MDVRSLFKEHIRIRQETTSRILQQSAYDGLVISSGSPLVYFADDREAPFQATPHFAHWCPQEGAHHLLHIQPGKKPRLLRYSPEDFWYEHLPLASSFWTDEFQVVEVGHKERLTAVLGQLSRHAFIGPEEAWAREQGLDANPASLVASLDWERGLKSDYEVYCLSKANEKAAVGHQAARASFARGASELEIHYAYVQALACTDDDLPYHSIVGIDAKSAVLHYQHKRCNKGGGVMLIDAGARFQHYASDITRTYAKAQVPTCFRALLTAMEALQQSLCARVTAGLEYWHLHDECHQRLAKILLDHEILRQCGVEEAIEQGLTRVFFPHGLGHMLGIQVHDVAGKQKNAQGDACEQPPKYPNLRMVRALREREVITMEPGLYFIPMLLAPMRQNGKARYFNFPLIDTLLPYGGIRIEDDLYLSGKVCRNLTREFLGNDFLLS